MIKNLNYSYVKNRQILHNVKLTFRKGETTAIVGPTGSGKTTILSLILRFYDYPDNTILIDGKDIKNLKISLLRDHIAWVSQETYLFNGTLRENIIYAVNRKVSEKELNNVIRAARLSELVDSLSKGVETEIGDRGVRLSGGEKQRVAIARALLRKSEIFLLDEATSALDSHTERLIQAAIKEALKNRTSIIVAHRLSTIKHADKIIVLDKGRVVEEGNIDNLLAMKGKFFDLWKDQQFF